MKIVSQLLEKQLKKISTPFKFPNAEQQYCKIN